MAIPEKPTLTAPPAAPIRGQDPTVFANRTNAYLAFITSNVSDLTAAIDWQNTVFTATEAEATSAEADAVTATQQRVLAQTAATLAQSSANFVGSWSTLTGSLDVPAVVFHDNNYWQLLVDLADVTAEEPGSSSDWKVAVLGANWQVISTSITLAANAYYAVDFGSSALTLTLPASPSTNDFVQLYKSAGASKGAVIARNGKTIMGVAEDLNIDEEITALYLVYNGTDWRIVR